MKEGFIKLDGQGKPKKSFYESLPKANKTLADMPKTARLLNIQCSPQPPPHKPIVDKR